VNEILFKSCVVLFLVSAPVLLVLRFSWPRRIPWWLLICVAALLGWVFSNLAVVFYYRHLDDQIAAAGGFDFAPPDLIDTWQSDGAKRVFAFFFGWLYGLIYLAPWLVIYAAIALGRKVIARRGSTAA
jgi:hypothetical protein